jgi:photosystem II PsbM protein
MVKAIQLAVLVLAFSSMAAAFAPSSPALAGLRAPALCTGAKLSPVCKAPRVQKSAMSMSLAETANQGMLLAAGMEVSAAAFLAVILGTFIPVVFLLTLFIQSEARKAAESGQE